MPTACSTYKCVHMYGFRRATLQMYICTMYICTFSYFEIDKSPEYFPIITKIDLSLWTMDMDIQSIGVNQVLL